MGDVRGARSFWLSFVNGQLRKELCKEVWDLGERTWSFTTGAFVLNVNLVLLPMHLLPYGNICRV